MYWLYIFGFYSFFLIKTWYTVSVAREERRKGEIKMKKLYRSSTNKMVAGVCGGIGEYFNVDPTLVRLGFVALSFLAGGGLLVYILATIIIPKEGTV